MLTLLPGPWPASVLLAAAMVALGAGVVRGFSGFGFSALTVAGLSLFVPPAKVVPAVLALEVLASVSMMRSAARDADMAWLRWLLVGNVVCIPIGLAALAVLPETWVRLLVGGALLVSSALILAAGSRTVAPSRGWRMSTGVVSGLLNGVAACGGISAAMMMAAARLPPAALRGTMITLLLFAGAYALTWSSVIPGGASSTSTLLGPDTARWALLLGPAMLGGIWIGRRSFSGVDPGRYRDLVLYLLMAISALGVLRSAFDLLKA